MTRPRPPRQTQPRPDPPKDPGAAPPPDGHGHQPGAHPECLAQARSPAGQDPRSGRASPCGLSRPCGKAARSCARRLRDAGPAPDTRIIPDDHAQAAEQELVAAERYAECARRPRTDQPKISDPYSHERRLSLRTYQAATCAGARGQRLLSVTGFIADSVLSLSFNLNSIHIRLYVAYSLIYLISSMRNGRFPHAGCCHTSRITRGNGRASYPATARFRAANDSGNRACPAVRRLRRCRIRRCSGTRSPASGRWSGWGVPAAAVRLPHGAGGRAVRAGRRGPVRGSRGDVAGAAVPGAGVHPRPRRAV